MKLQFHIVGPDKLAPFVAGLKELEQRISYPISDGNDSFVIDHGEHYHPFFSEMGQKARFLVVTANETVVGGLAGVWKECLVQGKKYTGLYFADLKLAPSYRGKKIPASMFFHGLRRWPFIKDYQGWDFAFYAAMHGEKGDVSHSFRRLHLGRLARPAAQLQLFFVPPEQLLDLANDSIQHPLQSSVHLSASNHDLVQWNYGKKDFQLGSTNQPWRLAHIQPFRPENHNLGQLLRQAGQHICQQDKDALACFGLDKRLRNHLQWLAKNGITSDTLCTIYSVSFFAPSLRKADYVTISTADI